MPQSDQERSDGSAKIIATRDADVEEMCRVIAEVSRAILSRRKEKVEEQRES